MDNPALMNMVRESLARMTLEAELFPPPMETPLFRPAGKGSPLFRPFKPSPEGAIPIPPPKALTLTPPSAQVLKDLTAVPQETRTRREEYFSRMMTRMTSPPARAVGLGATRVRAGFPVGRPSTPYPRLVPAVSATPSPEVLRLGELKNTLEELVLPPATASSSSYPPSSKKDTELN